MLEAASQTSVVFPFYPENFNHRGKTIAAMPVSGEPHPMVSLLRLCENRLREVRPMF